nr:hypothetical protein [Tanacetum cinerariifolium]
MIQRRLFVMVMLVVVKLVVATAIGDMDGGCYGGCDDGDNRYRFTVSSYIQFRGYLVLFSSTESETKGCRRGLGNAELAVASDVKENQKQDKIGSKPNKNGKRGEAEKSQKKLQWIKQVKLKKTQKEGPEMQIIQVSLEEKIASPEVTHEFHDSKGCNFLSEELPDIDSFNDIHPYFDDDLLSGSTTYSANSLLEEFADELALITYPLDYDDNRTCDIKSDLREIEFLLYQGEDSYFKDSIDQPDLANRDDLFVDPTPEMFTDEQPPDYSFPPRFDVYPDDFLEIESDTNNFDDDSFDSKGEKIKESELLIDQLDLPYDILSGYDSFNSQDFSRDDDFPSPDNEDKVFNPGILIHEKSFKIITRVAQEKKLAISFASLLFEDFDPPFYELLVFKEVPNSMRLLPFSSENEEKVFKPGIYTSEKVHFCFLPELSHPSYHVFEVNLIFLSLMKIFHVQSGKNTPHLDVLLFYFISLDSLKLKNTKKEQNRIKTRQNEKRGEAGKSQKQLQWIKQVKLKKTQKEGPEMQIIKFH